MTNEQPQNVEELASALFEKCKARLASTART